MATETTPGRSTGEGRGRRHATTLGSALGLAYAAFAVALARGWAAVRQPGRAASVPSGRNGGVGLPAPTLTAVLVAGALLLGRAGGVRAGAPPAVGAQDASPPAVAAALVAAWNAHDPDAVLALFADDGALGAGSWMTSGREALRAALVQRFAERPRLTPGPYEVERDTVRFPFTETNAQSARLGVAWREGTATVLVRDGRIVVFAQTDDPRAVARRAAAAGRFAQATLATRAAGGSSASPDTRGRATPAPGPWLLAAGLSLLGALLLALLKRPREAR